MRNMRVTASAGYVIMRIVNEDSTALNLFKAGQLDFVRPITFLTWPLAAHRRFIRPYFRTCFLNLNTANIPWPCKGSAGDRMSIDRSKLLRSCTTAQRNNRSRPEALFPQGKKHRLKFDPEAARKLLDEVGVIPQRFPLLSS